MKKLLLVAIFLFAGHLAMAQGTFRLGVNAGLPVGDIDDVSNFQLGADASYMFGVANVLEIGPLLGYSRYFIEDIDSPIGSIDTEDISYLPIAASGRLGLGLVFVGADLGYAVSLNDGGEGGLFWRPKLGIGFAAFSLIGSYQGISVDGGTFSSVNLGLEIGLGN